MNQDQRLTAAAVAGVQTQEIFEAAVEEAATIRLEKIIEYGESRHHRGDDHLTMLLAYADIDRKFIRVQNVIRHGDWKDLRRDDLLDLLNYTAEMLVHMDRIRGGTDQDYLHPSRRYQMTPRPITDRPQA